VVTSAGGAISRCTSALPTSYDTPSSLTRRLLTPRSRWQRTWPTISSSLSCRSTNISKPYRRYAALVLPSYNSATTQCPHVGLCYECRFHNPTCLRTPTIVVLRYLWDSWRRVYDYGYITTPAKAPVLYATGTCWRNLLDCFWCRYQVTSTRWTTEPWRFVQVKFRNRNSCYNGTIGLPI
jgi:hypothetical protein